MRFLIRYSLIRLGFVALVFTAFVNYPNLAQNVYARGAANLFETDAAPVSGGRANGHQFGEVFDLTIQAVPSGVPKVSPNSVIADAMGSTSVLLTFSGMKDFVPLEATFCTELVPANSKDPIGANLGSTCKPGTLIGPSLKRYALSTPGANDTLTSILTISPQTARRLFRGNHGTSFHVSRFVNKTTRLEVSVPVKIVLRSNGAGSPFSLADVRLAWVGENRNKPILFVKTGERLPPFQAEIKLTGSGNLKGSFSLAKPGDIPPGPGDLLTDAARPTERRGSPIQYTEISRFNVYIPPSGNYVLRGPDVSRLDTSIPGSYWIILHLEAPLDTQGPAPAPGAPGETTLEAALRMVPGGGAFAEPLPTLRYFVSNGSLTPPLTITSSNPLSFSPEDQATLDPAQPVDFTWPLNNAAKYRLQVEDLQGAEVISAILPAGVGKYRAPSWFKDRVGTRVVRWRVISFGQAGNELNKTEWRVLRFVRGTKGQNQQE